MRPDRDRRPRPDPRHRHARTSSSAGSSARSIFRLELDRLDGGVGAPRPAAGRRQRGPGRGDEADGRGDRQTVAVNLALVDDGGARRGRRRRSAASARTSSPSASPSRRSRTSSSSSSGAASTTPTSDGDDDRDRRTSRGEADATARDDGRRARARGGGGRDDRAARAPPAADDPAAAAVPRSSTARPRARRPPPTGRRARSLLTNLRTVLGRAYPRDHRPVRARSRWLFFEILLPFLATSAFVFVYRALQAPPQYIGFVVLGGAMTAFWLNVIWMMAEQLCWEKSQGNLELYFAAPMNIMAVLFGMAVGGLVMSSTRAAAVLVIATIALRRHVLGRPVAAAVARVPADARGALRARDDARQPVPDVGPRGVAPDPAPRRAGLLRVRAELPGRAASGVARRGRDRPSSRWRSGSTRCASSPSPARPTRSGTPPPEVEALILVVMVVVFIAPRALDARDARAAGPRRGPAVGALAMTAELTVRPRRRRPRLARVGRLRPGPDPRRRLRATSRRRSVTATRLGWQMEANWTDPLLFLIYSVAKPLASALILVVMLDVISGGGEARVPRLRRRRQRALVVRPVAASAASPGSILDDRERYRMLKYVYVSPSDFLVVLLGRGVARIGVGAMGAAITLARRRPLPRRAVRPGAVDWPLLVVVMALGVDRRSSRSGCCSPRSACRRARSRGRTRRPWPARCSSISGVVFPLAVLPAGRPGDRAADAADLVDRGRPRRRCSRAASRRSAAPGSL